MVEIHNYQNASSRSQKLTNWTTLNRKVLTKFGFAIPKEIIDDIIQTELGTHTLYIIILTAFRKNKLSAQPLGQDRHEKTPSISAYFFFISQKSDHEKNLIITKFHFEI